MPKPGWLNRQFEQVSKNVEAWPDWMKRAAGFESGCAGSQDNAPSAGDREEPRKEGPQAVLNLK